MKQLGAGTLLFVILTILLSRYVYVEDKIKKSNEIKKLLIEAEKNLLEISNKKPKLWIRN